MPEWAWTQLHSVEPWLNVINASISLEQIHPKWTLYFNITACISSPITRIHSCWIVYGHLNISPRSAFSRCVIEKKILNETVQHSSIATIKMVWHKTYLNSRRLILRKSCDTCETKHETKWIFLKKEFSFSNNSKVNRFLYDGNL